MDIAAGFRMAFKYVAIIAGMGALAILLLGAL